MKELPSSYVSEKVFIGLQLSRIHVCGQDQISDVHQTPVAVANHTIYTARTEKTSRNLDPTTSLLHISFSTIALLLAFVQPIPIRSSLLQSKGQVRICEVERLW